MILKIIAETNLELLCELKDQQGWHISDVAAKLGYKTPTGYWLIEKGQRKVSVDVLYKLSKLYNRPMEDFLIINDEEEIE